MPPISQRQLVPRSRDSDSHYAIVFAVLGSVILISGVVWGYLLPKWRKRHRRPVQTRYNCVGGTRNPRNQSDQDLELPVIFPPHPAVVVPSNKQRRSESQCRVHYSSSVPVYDPRTQSPFPKSPRAASCRPMTSGVSIRNRTAVPASKPINLHSARLQRGQSHRSWCPHHGNALPDSRSTCTAHTKVGYTQYDSMNDGRCSFLVARSAGAPPVKPKNARLALEKSRYQPPGRKVTATLSDSTFSAVNALEHSDLPRRNTSHEFNIKPHPRTANIGDKLMEHEILNDMKKQSRTPCQAGFGFDNIFETPSSPGTVTTTRFDSSGNRAHCDSTPPTGPSSSAVQPRGRIDPYPGISKLIPSRRFKDHIATTEMERTAWTEVVSDANSRLSSEDAHKADYIFRIGHRPVSAPPSSSRQATTIDREREDYPSLPEVDSMTDIHLHRNVSQHSLGSSVDSLTLFPRPLTFRRTITSQPPLVSPTPLGRHPQEIASPRHSLRRQFVEVRPVTRGKSPTFKRHNRMPSAFCLSGKQAAVSVTKPNAAYQNLERDPFTNQLGLARLGGNKRRSSIASISTFKIPKSFRPSISRGGSSVYSRDTKGASVLPSPGLGCEFSVSLKSLPELDPRRATSFDETIFKDLDWTPLRVDASNHVSPADGLEEDDQDVGLVPQTPTFHDGKSAPETPRVGTASSNTFGTRMPVPKISIARSSDDVFGAGPITERRNDVVVEDGRVFKRVRAMESKFSHEDLARYGGRTAPGGVEWF